MTPREKALFAMLIGEKYGELHSCALCGERYVIVTPGDRRQYEMLVKNNMDVATFKYCKICATKNGGGAAYRMSLKELLDEA